MNVKDELQEYLNIVATSHEKKERKKERKKEERKIYQV